VRHPPASSYTLPCTCPAGFYRAVGEFVVIICIAAPLFSFNSFLEDRLVLSWRAFLTRTLLDGYFENR
jgi:ABC-type uncharacterized transport system fused permease/ATPase subunit